MPENAILLYLCERGVVLSMDHYGPECCAFVRPNIYASATRVLSLHENKENLEAIAIFNIYGEL